MIIRVDLHAMTRQDAKRFIKNMIALLYMIPFRFDLIHGYNHGTVIKDMLRTDPISTRVKSITSPLWNPGESILEIAE